jgi:hypothetical protein
MSFDDEGFLSPDVTEFSSQNRKKFADLFLLVDDLNRFAHTVKFKFDIKNRDPQAITSFCLYMRVLGSYASSVRLAEIGLCHDAEAMARIAMEAMFFLKRCAESEDFVIEFIKSDHATRHKFMNLAPGLSGIIDMNPEEFAKIHASLAQEIEIDKIKEKKAEEVATKAGMQEMYDYVR